MASFSAASSTLSMSTAALLASGVAVTSLASKFQGSALAAEISKQFNLHPSTLSYYARVQSAYSAATVLDAFVKDSLMNVIPGKKSDRISGDLGDREFERLTNDAGLTLVKIHYLGRELDELTLRLAKSFIEPSKWTSDAVSAASGVSGARATEKLEKMTKRGWINHDFLILELQPGYDASKKICIHAEKVGAPEAGIFIGVITCDKSEKLLDSFAKVYTVHCGQRMRLDQIRDKLKEADATYCLKGANCWEYALSAMKRLLTACSVAEGVSPEEAKRLQGASAGLEANLNKNEMLCTFFQLCRRVGEGTSRRLGDVANSMLESKVY